MVFALFFPVAFVIVVFVVVVTDHVLRFCVYKTDISISVAARPGKPEVVSSRKGDYSDMYTLRWSVVSDVTPLVYHVMLRQVRPLLTYGA